MTIQRQYSLPNCKLVLEGLSDGTALDINRPLLSILVNAECHFTGYEKPLSGGREFLDSLIAAVSSYAQAFLSNVHRPLRSDQPASVQLQRISTNLHRLSVQTAEHHYNSTSEAIQIDLATVHLFDLVEAIDQLVADSQTLPDLTLDLTPVARRYVASSEPMAKRAVPAAIGVSSLAAAAAMLFFLPVPEVRRPQPSTDPAAAASSTAASTSPVATSPGSSPDPAASTPAVIAASPTPSPTGSVSPAPIASPKPSPTAPPVASGAPLNKAQLETLLASAPAVTDAAELRKLTLQLRDQLDRAWKQSPTFDQPLIYRVGVSEEGDVLGFKYVNDAAIAHVDATPLLDLRYNATEPNALSSEPIAQFRVVFTPSGAVQVSPWNGQPPRP